MLDFNPTPPRDATESWARLIRLVESIQDVKLIKGVSLLEGSEGVTLPHGCTRKVPAAVLVQLTGVGAATAVATVGAVDATHVTIYSTTDATADLFVVL